MIKPRMKKKLKYHIQQRMGFIYDCLRLDNRINRSDLMSKFDISLPTASSDIKLYQNLHGKLKYDMSAKCYRRK